MEVTLEGMVNDPVKPLQYAKAAAPTDVTEDGMFNDPERPEQPSKA